MTNHVHLLVETHEPNLGHGMRQLHGDYGRGFNGRHQTSGHVFQGRFGSVRIVDDRHLVTVVRYIDANPAEAGLDAWPWGSSAALAAAAAPPWLRSERLAELLGET